MPRHAHVSLEMGGINPDPPTPNKNDSCRCRDPKRWRKSNGHQIQHSCTFTENMLKKHEKTNWLLFPPFNVKVLKQKRQNIVRSVGLGSLRSKTRTKVPRTQWQIPSLWCWRPPPKRNPGLVLHLFILGALAVFHIMCWCDTYLKTSTYINQSDPISIN